MGFELSLDGADFEGLRDEPEIQVARAHVAKNCGKFRAILSRRLLRYPTPRLSIPRAVARPKGCP